MKDDRRTKRTINSINNAFIELMKKKDFNSITINEVSELADINRVTFYNYFLDKYDWYEKYLYQQLNSFIELERKLDFSLSDEEIYQSFYHVYQDIDYKFDILSILINDRSSLFHTYLTKVSKECYHDKIRPLKSYTKEELSFEINYYVSISVGLLEWWILEDRPFTIEDMAKKSTECLKHWII